MTAISLGTLRNAFGLGRGIGMEELEATAQNDLAAEGKFGGEMDVGVVIDDQNLPRRWS